MNQKVVVITGAASGIGKACVNEFNSLGYLTVSLDMNESETQSAYFLRTDISNVQDVEKSIKQIESKFNQIDALVNCAGICTNIPFLSMTKEEYNEVIQVNQFGTFFVMQAVARLMIKKNRGVIINVSSIFDEVASPGVLHYHASKAAVSMMTKSAALELAPYGIRVVAVAPGIVDTPMLEKDKEMGNWEELQQKHMRGKALEPKEIASVIAFLCTTAANGINGSIIPIEDGLLAKY